MNMEMNFEYEFSSLEKAMEFASNYDGQAIITNDHVMYYVVNCEDIHQYMQLGYDFV